MALTELRIASRRSQLAMVQTNWVKAELEKAHPGLNISVEAMATQGDKILDVALAKIGDKGLFTKELEAQMLVDRADIAVHSLKDLPTNLPEGLMLGCITEREDPADALVVNAKNQAYQLHSLPEGSVVGTSSLRRLAQLRQRRAGECDHPTGKARFRRVRLPDPCCGWPRPPGLCRSNSPIDPRRHLPARRWSGGTGN